MDTGHGLAGLDVAGVSDEGLPELLHTIRSGDESAAVEAVHTVRWEILHQGTTYAATEPTVPFLAELVPVVSSGVVRGCLLDLLGDLALSGMDDAVTAHVGVLLPALGDPDPWARYCAAYALAGCTSRAGDILPALREHWAVETDPRVRAGVVQAAARLDPSTDLVDLALAAEQPPAVLAGAVLAIVETGRPWPGELALAAVREAWRDGDPLAADDPQRPVYYPGALEQLINRAAPADRPPVVAALLQSADAEVRVRAAGHAATAVAESRSIREPMAEVMADALTDPDPRVRLAAAQAIRQAGPAARPVADKLAAYAASHDDEAARQAAATLRDLGDPRGRRRGAKRVTPGTAPPILDPQATVEAARAHWRRTGNPEQAIDHAWKHITGERSATDAIALLEDIGEPAHRLLPQIRRALAEWARDIPLHRGELARLARLAWQWSGDPADAEPTVRAFLDRLGDGPIYFGQTESAILAAEMGLPGAADTLTGPVAIHTRPYRQALRGLRALWRLTGDPEHVLPHVVNRLTAAGSEFTKTNWMLSLELLAELGPAAAPALATLRDFAERDEAIAGPDPGESPGHADEQVRAAIRSAADATS